MNVAHKAKKARKVGFHTRPTTGLRGRWEDDGKKANMQLSTYRKHEEAHIDPSQKDHDERESDKPSTPSDSDTNHEENLKKTSTEHRVPDIGEFLSERNVSGVVDPRHRNDVTVHLKMPAHEDLDEVFEEFYRLQRLGNFTSAKQFFEENLREYLTRPSILIGYAEMLLEQGDYGALSKIDDNMMRSACSSLVDMGDRLMLTIYWDLLKVLVAHYKPGGLGAFLIKSGLVDQALSHLRVTMNLGGAGVTSTEVKMLALLYHLGTFVDDRIYERLDELFPLEYHRALYTHFIGQGRIWDLRDISVARTACGIDVTQDWSEDLSFRKRTQTLIENWVDVDGGTSTTLALLDILVFLALHELKNPERDCNRVGYFLEKAQSFALSIVQTDPACMESRPFARWMLAKAQFTNDIRSHGGPSRERPFRSSPGVVFTWTDSQLPQYIPSKGENPGWDLNNPISEFERSIKMALKISRSLNDYQTEAMALQKLIMLSANPKKEFEELCKLQKWTQEDTYGYADTLISKYLISGTDESKSALKSEIYGLFTIPDFPECLSKLKSWMLNRLQYSLEDEGPAAERALQESHKDYQHLDQVYRQMIDEKLLGARPLSSRTDYGLRHNQPNVQGTQHKPVQNERDKIPVMERNTTTAKSNESTERPTPEPRKGINRTRALRINRNARSGKTPPYEEDVLTMSDNSQDYETITSDSSLATDERWPGNLDRPLGKELIAKERYPEIAGDSMSIKKSVEQANIAPSNKVGYDTESESDVPPPRAMSVAASSTLVPSIIKPVEEDSGDSKNKDERIAGEEENAKKLEMESMTGEEKEKPPQD
ncbi:uncharacterized protein F4822DRAFT_410099 [Hypoxylon trugodes]|uniref:uncharacterized protein n=1 Tax=Hypoxylon trugodes TaxID=326681 RepID=UPI002194853F|nr:uncharacterized protein F4822DRAFT_410099 [Hypoxylon trugodes]KAI1386450.1 hypothetical protein F4822DRAFT_410099 [Hypoxylon trugodes]